jgi:hypothetical protein
MLITCHGLQSFIYPPLILSRVMALLCVEDPVPHMPDIYTVESALLTLAAPNRIS